MSSLAAKLADLKPTRRTTCWYKAFQLDDIDRQAIDKALTDWTIPGTHIAAALTAEGHLVKGPDVQRHRRGECSCGDR